MISNTDYSWPDNSNSTFGNQPSTSGQQLTGQDNQDLDSNSSTDSSEADTTPPKIQKIISQIKILLTRGRIQRKHCGNQHQKW